MIRWLMLLGILMGCTGARYERGPRANALAQGPVRHLQQQVEGPLAWINISVRAGSAHDPIGREGTAWLAAHLIREGGTEALSPEQVEQLLSSMGTDIKVVVDREMISFRVSCLVEDVAPIAELLSEMFTSPRLDPAVFERLQSESESWLERGITEDDEGLGKAAFETMLFSGHPYGHPLRGRAGVVRTLSVADVERFLSTRFVRPAVVLGTAGQVPEDVKARLSDALSGFSPTLYKDVTPRPVAQQKGRRLLIVEKPTEATGIHFGHFTSLRRDHPDWPAMLLATTALGEHRQSHGRLYQRLREARGLNYGDYAYIETYQQAGWSSKQQTGTGRMDNPFSVWIRPVTPDNAAFALKGAVDAVDEWVTNGLDEAEFERIQAYLSRRVALWAADPGRRLGWAVEAELMGWPNPIEDLPDRIRALDRVGVNQAIGRHVQTDNLAIVAVTADGESLASTLSTTAPTPIAYASSPPSAESDQAAEDARIAALDLELAEVLRVSTSGLFR